MSELAPAGLTSAFRTRVGDAAGAPPVVLQADVSVADAVARLTAAQQSVAVVVDEFGAVVGIVTEQDVVRRVTFKKPPDAVCREVMTSPVNALRAEEKLYQAIAAMRRHRLRHMPVVDARGRPAGMLNLADALHVANARVISQLERLIYEPTVPSMADARAVQADIAAELIADGARGPEIHAWLSDFNNELHARVAEICVERMRRGVAGQPPIPFALIVMGSGGRGESGLAPDQDNGLVLDEYPDSDHRRVDLWFRSFAIRLTRALAELGFPLCRGGVMSTNPLWRKSLPQWRAQLSCWMRRRNPAVLRSADIFFDFRGVWGELALADALRQHVGAAIRTAPAFLESIARQEDDYEVALGFFRRFAVERDNLAHRGEVNLKLGALTPMIDAVRLLALRAGIEETSTLARLAGLQARSVLSRDEADRLTAGYADLADMLLRRQIQDIRSGRDPTAFVPPQALTARERDRLEEALRSIRELRTRVRLDLLGQAF